MTKRAYSYVRMSSKKQMSGTSRERQIKNTIKYIEEKGWVLDETIEDLGVSAFTGKNANEGGLAQFIEMCRHGKIEKGSVLVIESLDRISRQEPLKAFDLFSTILTLGIDIVTLTDQQHYTKQSVNKNMSELFISLGTLARAHDESRHKQQRLLEKWEIARNEIKTGNKKLTKKCPAWLTLSEDRMEFIIDQDCVKNIEKMFQLCIDGFGYNAISKIFNDEKIPTVSGSKGWQPFYIKRILTRGDVLGHFQPHKMQNGKRVPIGDPITDYYPQIIDDNMFYKAQKAIKDRTDLGAGRKGPQVSNLFSRLIKCGKCGGGMSYKKYTRRTKERRKEQILQCLASRRGMCDHKRHYHYLEFENLMLKNLQELSLVHLDAELDTRIVELNNQIISNTEQIERLSKQIKKLTLLYSESDDEQEDQDTLATLSELKDKRKKLQKRLINDKSELNSLSVNADNANDKISNIQIIAKKMDDANDNEKEIHHLRSIIQQELKGVISLIQFAEDGNIFIQTKADNDAQYIIDTFAIKDTEKFGVMHGAIEKITKHVIQTKHTRKNYFTRIQNRTSA